MIHEKNQMGTAHSNKETLDELMQKRKSIRVDGHVDLPYYLRRRAGNPSVGDLADGPFTLEMAFRSGFRLFCTALYCEDRYNGKGAMDHLQEVMRFTIERFDRVRLIEEKEHLRELIDDSQLMGSLLLLENADALAEDPHYVEHLKDAGIRMIGLTHAGKNRLADGNGVSFPDGFSRAGIDVLHALQHNALGLDVAHLHPKSFWQLLDLFEGPIITSHTGVRTACDTTRNIDLDQAKEIFSRGGMVGVTFNPEMINPEKKAKIENVFVHMDTLVQKFGPEGIGIGSDFCGFDERTEGLEDITKVERLAEIMIEHGYDAEDVEKIMGLNWLRFYENMFETGQA